MFPPWSSFHRIGFALAPPQHAGFVEVSTENDGGRDWLLMKKTDLDVLPIQPTPEIPAPASSPRPIV